MRVYLITHEQISELYASGTIGSRNYERVIQRVKTQEVKPEAVKVKELLKLKL